MSPFEQRESGGSVRAGLRVDLNLEARGSNRHRTGGTRDLLLLAGICLTNRGKSLTVILRAVPGFRLMSQPTRRILSDVPRVNFRSLQNHSGSEQKGGIKRSPADVFHASQDNKARRTRLAANRRGAALYPRHFIDARTWDAASRHTDHGNRTLPRNNRMRTAYSRDITVNASAMPATYEVPEVGL